jgi:hypothetical protein
MIFRKTEYQYTIFFIRIMKPVHWIITTALAAVTAAGAQVRVDKEALGKSLGGWNKRSHTAAEYALSGNTYRTFKPEATPTPTGGLFVSVRIDHVRGWLSSDDHATLEVTFDSKGRIESAQSNIAIQGRSISSDVIVGTGEAVRHVADMDHAVQVGTDLVANLTAKLLREKIVEAGRVSFPAAVRHNYNLLFQAVRYEPPAAATGGGTEPLAPTTEEKPDKQEPEAPATEPAKSAPLEVKPYGTPEVIMPKGG